MFQQCFTTLNKVNISCFAFFLMKSADTKTIHCFLDFLVVSEELSKDKKKIQQCLLKLTSVRDLQLLSRSLSDI